MGTMRRRYNPSRGGHAPGHLRDAFKVLVEECQSSDTIPETFTDGDETWASRRLIGLLWNCTDTMPSDLCADLELHQGSTYARGARELVRELQLERVAPPDRLQPRCTAEELEKPLLREKVVSVDPKTRTYKTAWVEVQKRK